MAAKNLSGILQLRFDLYASVAGTNLKFGIHDTGGTTTEYTPALTATNVWETFDWDISAVADANKDAIDTLIITVIGAALPNTFYIDNFYGIAAPVVTTQAVTGIGTVQASANGNITDLSGELASTRGFKYGLTGTDTWSASEIGTFSEGAFAGLLSSLTANTTYYVRAFVTDSLGTAYGSYVTFATEAIPFPIIDSKDYRIELRDNNGTLLSYIQNLVDKAAWSWDRVGGCGDCSLRLKTDFDGVLAGSFTEDSEIRIYIPSVAGTAELWYSGYIDKVTPSISLDESIELYCLGYVNQLKRVIVREKTYIGNEIAEIVRNIAEVYATAYTGIISTAPNYEITDFTADSIYFNESAFEAMTKLADIAGKREWGVGADKKIFFKRRDDSIKNYFNLTHDFTSFQPVKDFNPIVTKIFLEGSDGYKQTFEITNKISVREKVISNSSISTESVAYQFARAYLKENGMIRRSYTAKQIGRQTRIESTVPIGRAMISAKIGIRSKYDVAANKYDAGIKYDGDNLTLQVERIKYELTDTGVNATLYLGAIPPSITDELAKLEYMINQTQNTI